MYQFLNFGFFPLSNVEGHACSIVSDSVTPWAAAHQAPLSMGFSRKEYWSELSFPPPGDLLHPGTKPVFPEAPALAGGFFTTEPPEKSFKREAWSYFSNRPKGRRGPLAL